MRCLKLYLRNISFTSLLLSSCLGCIPLLIGLSFLRGLLTRMFFLPCAFHVVVSCLCFCVLLLYFYCASLLCPSLATISFAGYFPAVSFCLLSLLFSLGCVFGLIWFSSVYLVTTAGFVADQSM